MAAGASGQVLALDGRDGSVLWRMVGLDGLQEYAPVVAEDGAVIVRASVRGETTVFAIRGGQMAWQIPFRWDGICNLDTSDGVTYIQSSPVPSYAVTPGDDWYLVAVSSQGTPQWTFSPKIFI